MAAAVVVACAAGCSGSSTEPSDGSGSGISGLSNTGASLSGNTDTAWEVECAPLDVTTPACPVSGFQRAQRVLAPFLEWVAPPSGTSWIGVNDRATVPAGLNDNRQRYRYTFRTQFDLSDFDPSTVRMTLGWAADNYFGGYRLNTTGSFVGALPDNRQWFDFKALTLAAPAVTFTAGRNVLEIRVLGDGQSDGLIVRSFSGSGTRR
jgi:hypothetical protein